MRRLLEALLPAHADNTVRGPKLPVYIFAVITLVSTVRSFIHVLAPDGGAGSIAGMNLSAGGPEIVFAFALWGSAQLVYAVIQLVVLIRYRSLIPFMYVVLMLETLLRILVAHIKPVAFAHTPPGVLQNYIYVPLAVLMLFLSFRGGAGRISSKGTF